MGKTIFVIGPRQQTRPKDVINYKKKLKRNLVQLFKQNPKIKQLVQFFRDRTQAADKARKWHKLDKYESRSETWVKLFN